MTALPAPEPNCAGHPHSDGFAGSALTSDNHDVPVRLPKGAECECRADGCGLFFSSETAFTKHWTRGGHAHPREVGLVERHHRAGPVWGWPAMPANALLARQEGAI